MILYDLPADLVGTDDRLDNWGRWARDLNQRPGYARSVESRYRRPAAEDDPRRRPTMPIDAIDAQFVGRALAPVAGMPWREARLLQEHYVYQADYRTICRRLALAWSRYREEVIRALWMARNRIAQRETLGHGPKTDA